MRVELRHLRYFIAVAETLNFRAAAERLNLSKPALSKQVRDLEEELGVRLLDRDTRHVRLTNAGAVFLTEARALVGQAARAAQKAREAAKGRRGRLAVGNIGPITAVYMAACLTAFCARYPEVEVELIDLDIAAQVEALVKNAIHVGFVPAQSVGLLPAGFRNVPVLTAPLGAALGSGHPLARRRAVTLQELADERILCVHAREAVSRHADYVLSLFRTRGLKPARIVEVKGYESLLAMIAAGQGVSLLAGQGQLTRVDNVMMRPLKDRGADTVVDVRAVWRKEAAGPLAENFIEVFRGLNHGGGAGRSRALSIDSFLAMKGPSLSA